MGGTIAWWLCRYLATSQGAKQRLARPSAASWNVNGCTSSSGRWPDKPTCSLGRSIVTHSRMSERGKTPEFLLFCTNKDKQPDNRRPDIVHGWTKRNGGNGGPSFASCFPNFALLLCVAQRPSRSTRPTNLLTNSTFPHEPRSTLIPPPPTSSTTCMLPHPLLLLPFNRRNPPSLPPSDFYFPSSRGNTFYA